MTVKFPHQFKFIAHGGSTIDVRCLNQYTLPTRLPLLLSIAALNKKDKGLKRILNRFIDSVKRPSILGQECIDFTFCLDHFNPGGQVVTDWYTQLLEQLPGLQEKEVFEVVALLVVRHLVVIARMCLENFNEEDRAQLEPLLRVRFEQVFDPVRASGAVKLLPVVSVLIPTDFDAKTAKWRLDYAGMLVQLADNYQAENIINWFHSAYDDHVNLASEPGDLDAKRVYARLLSRQDSIYSVYEQVDQTVGTDSEAQLHAVFQLTTLESDSEINTPG